MRRSVHVVVLALLALLLLGPVPRSVAGPPSARLPVADPTAETALGVGAGDAAAYGTGTVVHADALRSGTHSLVGVDVAFSGSAFSTAAPSREYTNEVHRLVAPKLAANAGRGRGTGLELGVGSDPVPLIGQLSQASAPPSTRLLESVVGPIGVPGVVSAELLRSQAQARAVDNGCVLGREQAYGLGSVLNLNLLGGVLATVADPPVREISQSTSNSRIVPGSTAGRLGLRSETRQTIAPVTFFKGTPAQFTVEVLGEWALRAIADGAKGQISYGPLSASPETPVLRILGDHGQVVSQLTTQQVLGEKGLEVTIPGVAEIVLGEDPRMIDGDAASSPVVKPTLAAAAVDVVRVKLLTGTLADVRVGHMEAAVTVPAGGVQCPGITVTQTVDNPSVTPGGEFVYTITVTNPNDCDLVDLKLVETVTVPSGVKIALVSATPPGADLSGNTATWPDLGPLEAGQSKILTVKVTIPADSAAGKLSALAVADGVCPARPLPTTDVHPPALPAVPGPSPEDIPVTGQAPVDGPTIGVCVVPSVKGLALPQAKAILEAAGCTLGDVTGSPTATPTDLGKVVDQGPPPVDSTVPLGTPVPVVIGGPLCTVPNLALLTPEEARTRLEAAGCRLGTVTVGPPGGNPGDAGKITTQTPPAGDKVPAGTTVDVTLIPALAASQSCTVPGVTGLTEADARAKVEAAGCVLVTKEANTTNPAEVGKVISQSPAPATVVARGSTVNATLGVAVAGQSLQRAAGSNSPAGSTLPQLARTGGVALAGLSLWLVVTGLLSQLAGSERLWRLARRLGR